MFSEQIESVNNIVGKQRFANLPIGTIFIWHNNCFMLLQHKTLPNSDMLKFCCLTENGVVIEMTYFKFAQLDFYENLDNFKIIFMPNET